MRESELKSKVAEVLAEKFLRELERNTPVQRGFLKGIRPAIFKLFKELPEDKQALLMYFVKTEARETRDGLVNLKWIDDVTPVPPATVNPQSLERVKKQIQYVHGVVASTMLISYGGLGETQVAIEG